MKIKYRKCHIFDGCWIIASYGNKFVAWSLSRHIWLSRDDMHDEPYIGKRDINTYLQRRCDRWYAKLGVMNKKITKLQALIETGTTEEKILEMIRSTKW